MKIKKFNKKFDVETCNRWIDAAYENIISEIKKLIDDGFPVDYEDGWTALIWASKNGNLEMIDILMKAGADVDHQNYNGYSALMKAAGWGNLESVKYLIEKYNANIDLKNIKYEYSSTSLILAARNNHLDIVKYLLKKGANYKHSYPDFYDVSIEHSPKVKEWIEENMPEYIEERLIKSRASKFGL